MWMGCPLSLLKHTGESDGTHSCSEFSDGSTSGKGGEIKGCVHGGGKVIEMDRGLLPKGDEKT